MNIPQIAQAMGSTVTFGELPDYSLIITNINLYLAPEQHITQETTGSAFMEIFSQQTADVKNKISIIIEHDVELKCEIVTDLTLRNMAKDRVESDAKRNNQMVLGFILLMVLSISLYSAYGYHVEAVKMLGDKYASTTMSLLGTIYNYLQTFIPQS